MLTHEQAGLPPLLHFDYETILDACRFAPPSNYALLRISACGSDHWEKNVDETKRPVIVIDPRAGHGPGIGGFKRDSEVGIAMHQGHPVHFIMFFPEPCPGKTLTDVLYTLRRFVEEVGRRHKGAAPALYGNCQAGWVVTLLAADCVGYGVDRFERLAAVLPGPVRATPIRCGSPAGSPGTPGSPASSPTRYTAADR